MERESPRTADDAFDDCDSDSDDSGAVRQQRRSRRVRIQDSEDEAMRIAENLLADEEAEEEDAEEESEEETTPRKSSRKSSGEPRDTVDGTCARLTERAGGADLFAQEFRRIFHDGQQQLHSLEQAWDDESRRLGRPSDVPASTKPERWPKSVTAASREYIDAHKEYLANRHKVIQGRSRQKLRLMKEASQHQQRDSAVESKSEEIASALDEMQRPARLRKKTIFLHDLTPQQANSGIMAAEAGLASSRKTVASRSGSVASRSVASRSVTSKPDVIDITAEESESESARQVSAHIRAMKEKQMKRRGEGPAGKEKAAAAAAKPQPDPLPNSQDIDALLANLSLVETSLQSKTYRDKHGRTPAFYEETGAADIDDAERVKLDDESRHLFFGPSLRTLFRWNFQDVIWHHGVTTHYLESPAFTDEQPLVVRVYCQLSETQAATAILVTEDLVYLLTTYKLDGQQTYSPERGRLFDSTVCSLQCLSACLCVAFEIARRVGIFKQWVREHNVIHAQLGQADLAPLLPAFSPLPPEILADKDRFRWRKAFTKKEMMLDSRVKEIKQPSADTPFFTMTFVGLMHFRLWLMCSLNQLDQTTPERRGIMIGLADVSESTGRQARLMNILASQCFGSYSASDMVDAYYKRYGHVLQTFLRDGWPWNISNGPLVNLKEENAIHPSPYRELANVRAITIGTTAGGLKKIDSGPSVLNESNTNPYVLKWLQKVSLMQEVAFAAVAEYQTKRHPCPFDLAWLKDFPKWYPGLEKPDVFSRVKYLYAPFIDDARSPYWKSLNEHNREEALRLKLVEQTKLDEYPWSMFETPNVLVFEPDDNQLMQFILQHLRTHLHSLSNNLTVKNVLLHGRPGGGKTYTLQAVAALMGLNFFRISPGLINSKWFGETDQTVRALQSIFATHQPLMVFIDEADGVLGGGSKTLKQGDIAGKTALAFQTLVQGENTQLPYGTLAVFVAPAINYLTSLSDVMRARFKQTINTDDTKRFPITRGVYLSVIVSVLRKKGDIMDMEMATGPSEFDPRGIFGTLVDDLLLPFQERDMRIITFATEVAYNALARSHQMEQEKQEQQALNQATSDAMVKGHQAEQLLTPDKELQAQVSLMLHRTAKASADVNERRSIIRNREDLRLFHREFELTFREQMGERDRITTEADPPAYARGRDPHPITRVSPEAEVEEDDEEGDIGMAQIQRVEETEIEIKGPQKTQLLPAIQEDRAILMKLSDTQKQELKVSQVIDSLGPLEQAVVVGLQKRDYKELDELDRPWSHWESVHKVTGAEAEEKHMEVERQLIEKQKADDDVLVKALVDYIKKRQELGNIVHKVQKSSSPADDSIPSSPPVVDINNMGVPGSAGNVGLLYHLVECLLDPAVNPSAQFVFVRRIERLMGAEEFRLTDAWADQSGFNALLLAINSSSAWYQDRDPQRRQKRLDALAFVLEALCADAVHTTDQEFLSRSLEIAYLSHGDSAVCTALLEKGAHWPIVSILSLSDYSRFNSETLFIRSRQLHISHAYRLFDSAKDGLVFVNEQCTIAKTFADQEDADVQSDVETASLMSEEEEEKQDPKQGYTLAFTGTLDRIQQKQHVESSAVLIDALRVRSTQSIDDMISSIVVAAEQSRSSSEHKSTFAITHSAHGVPATLQFLFYSAMRRGNIAAVTAILELLEQMPDSLVTIYEGMTEEEMVRNTCTLLCAPFVEIFTNHTLITLSYVIFCMQRSTQLPTQCPLLDSITEHLLPDQRAPLMELSTHARRFIATLLMMKLDGVPLFIDLMRSGTSSTAFLKSMLILYDRYIPNSLMVPLLGERLVDERYDAPALLWWVDRKQRPIDGEEDCFILSHLVVQLKQSPATLYERSYDAVRFSNSSHRSAPLIAAHSGRLAAVHWLCEKFKMTTVDLDDFGRSLLDLLLDYYFPPQEEVDTLEEKSPQAGFAMETEEKKSTITPSIGTSTTQPMLALSLSSSVSLPSSQMEIDFPSRAGISVSAPDEPIAQSARSSNEGASLSSSVPMTDISEAPILAPASAPAHAGGNITGVNPLSTSHRPLLMKIESTVEKFTDTEIRARDDAIIHCRHGIEIGILRKQTMDANPIDRFRMHFYAAIPLNMANCWYNVTIALLRLLIDYRQIDPSPPDDRFLSDRRKLYESVYRSIDLMEVTWEHHVRLHERQKALKKLSALEKSHSMTVDADHPGKIIGDLLTMMRRPRAANADTAYVNTAVSLRTQLAQLDREVGRGAAPFPWVVPDGQSSGSGASVSTSQPVQRMNPARLEVGQSDPFEAYARLMLTQKLLSHEVWTVDQMTLAETMDPLIQLHFPRQGVLARRANDCYITRYQLYLCMGPQKSGCRMNHYNKDMNPENVDYVLFVAVADSNLEDAVPTVVSLQQRMDTLFSGLPRDVGDHMRCVACDPLMRDVPARSITRLLDPAPLFLTVQFLAPQSRDRAKAASPVGAAYFWKGRMGIPRALLVEFESADDPKSTSTMVYSLQLVVLVQGIQSGASHWVFLLPSANRSESDKWEFYDGGHEPVHVSDAERRADIFVVGDKTIPGLLGKAMGAQYVLVGLISSRAAQELLQTERREVDAANQFVDTMRQVAQKTREQPSSSLQDYVAKISAQSLTEHNLLQIAPLLPNSTRVPEALQVLLDKFPYIWNPLETLRRKMVKVNRLSPLAQGEPREVVKILAAHGLSIEVWNPEGQETLTVESDNFVVTKQEARQIEVEWSRRVQQSEIVMQTIITRNKPLKNERTQKTLARAVADASDTRNNLVALRMYQYIPPESVSPLVKYNELVVLTEKDQLQVLRDYVIPPMRDKKMIDQQKLLIEWQPMLQHGFVCVCCHFTFCHFYYVECDTCHGIQEDDDFFNVVPRMRCCYSCMRKLESKQVDAAVIHAASPSSPPTKTATVTDWWKWYTTRALNTLNKLVAGTLHDLASNEEFDEHNHIMHVEGMPGEERRSTEVLADSRNHSWKINSIPKKPDPSLQDLKSASSKLLMYRTYETVRRESAIQLTTKVAKKLIKKRGFETVLDSVTKDTGVATSHVAAEAPGTKRARIDIEHLTTSVQETDPINLMSDDVPFSGSSSPRQVRGDLAALQVAGMDIDQFSSVATQSSLAVASISSGTEIPIEDIESEADEYRSFRHLILADLSHAHFTFSNGVRLSMNILLLQKAEILRHLSRMNSDTSRIHRFRVMRMQAPYCITLQMINIPSSQVHAASLPPLTVLVGYHSLYLMAISGWIVQQRRLLEDPSRIEQYPAPELVNYGEIRRILVLRKRTGWDSKVPRSHAELTHPMTALVRTPYTENMPMTFIDFAQRDMSYINLAIIEHNLSVLSSNPLWSKTVETRERLITLQDAINLRHRVPSRITELNLTQESSHDLPLVPFPHVYRHRKKLLLFAFMTCAPSDKKYKEFMKELIDEWEPQFKSDLLLFKQRNSEPPNRFTAMPHFPIAEHRNSSGLRPYDMNKPIASLSITGPSSVSVGDAASMPAGSTLDMISVHIFTLPFRLDPRTNNIVTLRGTSQNGMYLLIHIRADAATSAQLHDAVATVTPFLPMHYTEAPLILLRRSTTTSTVAAGVAYIGEGQELPENAILSQIGITSHSVLYVRPNDQ